MLAENMQTISPKKRKRQQIFFGSENRHRSLSDEDRERRNIGVSVRAGTQKCGGTGYEEERVRFYVPTSEGVHHESPGHLRMENLPIPETLPDFDKCLFARLKCADYPRIEMGSLFIQDNRFGHLMGIGSLVDPSADKGIVYVG